MEPGEPGMDNGPELPLELYLCGTPGLCGTATGGVGYALPAMDPCESFRAGCLRGSLVPVQERLRS